MANVQVESKIRDWLSMNLNFIEPCLKLIGKEFHLPDSIGSKGFIDLLCTDRYNNYVIIEIKRSETSARQTITEVLKYISLIKHNFKARESEIRIIVISTHWNELIRAFSEIFYKDGISIKGYKIEIDELSVPHSIKLVDPLPADFIARKFAFWQGLYLFTTDEKREVFYSYFKQRISSTSIADYVQISLDAQDDKEKVLTPFALVVGFQKQSIQDLLSAIEILCTGKDMDVMGEEEFDDLESYQIHLEDAFIGALAMYKHTDDIEAGYSEKFDSMLNNQGWTIQAIHKSGIFKIDPRYSDELLIKELRGHDGNSKNKFVGFAESTQPDRIKEIYQQSRNCLKHTPQWAVFIEQIFEDLNKREEKFRIIIDVYNPDSIIISFFFTIINANLDYLPLYKIIIDYIDQPKTVIYTGELYWNKRNPTAKLFNPLSKTESGDEIFRLNINPDNLMDSYRMALNYTNSKTVIQNNEEVFNEFLLFNDNEFVKDHTIYASIEEYVVYTKDRIINMISNFNGSYISM